jgi:hypothetical protein
MKSKVLNLLLIVTPLIGYLEWGNHNSMFLYQGELEVVYRLFTAPTSVLHPLTLLPLFGQIILFITLFQKEPSKRWTYIAIGSLSMLLLLMLFVGILELNFKIISSTIPFLITAILTIIHFRKTYPNNHNSNRITKDLIIHSTPEQIFKTLSDVEHWNLWTKSINSISFVDSDHFAEGGKAKVIQPKLFPAIWTITEVIENKSFTWETTSIGLKMIAKHNLTVTDQGTLVELEMIYTGFLAKLFYTLTSKLTTEYLNMELNGLKEQCEK